MLKKVGFFLSSDHPKEGSSAVKGNVAGYSN